MATSLVNITESLALNLTSNFTAQINMTMQQSVEIEMPSFSYITPREAEIQDFAAEFQKFDPEKAKNTPYRKFKRAMGGCLENFLTRMPALNSMLKMVLGKDDAGLIDESLGKDETEATVDSLLQCTKESFAKEDLAAYHHNMECIWNMLDKERSALEAYQAGLQLVFSSNAPKTDCIDKFYASSKVARKHIELLLDKDKTGDAAFICGPADGKVPMACAREFCAGLNKFADLPSKLSILEGTLLKGTEECIEPLKDEQDRLDVELSKTFKKLSGEEREPQEPKKEPKSDKNAELKKKLAEKMDAFKAKRTRSR